MGGFFVVFEIIFVVIFLMVISTFIFIFAKNIGTWKKNNNSPRISVNATAVDKRAHYSHGRHTHSSRYYITFEFDSGDRMELCVPGEEYGLIVNGDFGTLTFQGTRYISFHRGA